MITLAIIVLLAGGELIRQYVTGALAMPEEQR